MRTLNKTTITKFKFPLKRLRVYVYRPEVGVIQGIFPLVLVKKIQKALCLEKVARINIYSYSPSYCTFFQSYVWNRFLRDGRGDFDYAYFPWEI